MSDYDALRDKALAESDALRIAQSLPQVTADTLRLLYLSGFNDGLQAGLAKAQDTFREIFAELRNGAPLQ